MSEERVADLFDAPPPTIPPTTPSATVVAPPPPARTVAGEGAATVPRRPIELPPLAPAPARSGALRWILGMAAGLAVVTAAGVGLYLFGSRGATPSGPEGLAEADRLLLAGRYADAAGAYTRVLSRQGDLPAAYLGRGRARLAEGDENGGLSDLERAATLPSSDATVLEELADALYDRGRFSDAVKRYAEAVAREPGRAELRFRLGSSLFQAGRAAEALPHVEAALAASPGLAEARFLYARALNAQARYAEAERELTKLRGQLPLRGDFFAELGITLLEQGKVEQAETVAREFVAFDVNDARSHGLLGDVFLRKKQFEPAREELIRALTTNPKETRARIALGKTWLALGDAAKAREALAEPSPGIEGDRLIVLGQVSLAEGKPDEAIAFVEKAVREGARPLPAHLVLASARYTRRDLPGAANELITASKLAPSDAAIPLSLALVLTELKEATRASEQFLEALRGSGVTGPPEGAGPVVLPAPYIPVPPRFDLTKVIRTTYKQALTSSPEDVSALALKTLAETVSFVFAES